MTAQSIQAWKELCARLEQLGEEVLGEEYATADALEMLEHVADQTANWLSWFVFHADPNRPFWHRQQDLVGRYGGPNADNIYRHVRLDPSLRYRVVGHMHGCDDWLLTLRTAFMFQNGTTLMDYTASDLGFRRGEPFEFLLGGADGLPIPEGVIMGTVREYYIDWQPEEPATFTVECLDAPEFSTPLTDELLADRFRTAQLGVDHSVVYWNQYLENVRAAGPPNEFAPSHRGAKGLQLAQYLFCHWDLAPDETLTIDTDLPAARYCSVHLYPLGTFEHLDLHDRITSLNHLQLAVDDGRIQVAVGGVDPGWPNWLDTGGRQRGLLIYRWFWPTEEDADPPVPSTKVVPVASLSGPVTPEQRRETMAARRRHLTWRFRE